MVVFALHMLCRISRHLTYCQDHTFTASALRAPRLSQAASRFPILFVESWTKSGLLLSFVLSPVVTRAGWLVHAIEITAYLYIHVRDEAVQV